MTDTPHNETAKAYAAFLAYCEMGPGRSLSKLADKLRQSDVKATARLRTLQEWSSEHKWQERVKLYDEEQLKRIDAVIAAEKEQVIRAGFALVHKRIAALDKLANQLLGYTTDEDKVWLPDVKAIGNGPGAERVDLIQFNAPLFAQIRGVFGDIASEMGERVKKKELNVKGMPANVYFGFNPDEDGNDGD